MLKRTSLKPGKPLARSKKPMRRAAPLAVVSKTGQKGKREQKKAYAEADDAEQEYCSVCGLAGPTEHMHLYTQKQMPHLRNEPLNWLVVGRWCDCHRLQENNKPEFARRYPDAWELIINRMQALDAAAFSAFLLKNNFQP